MKNAAILLEDGTILPAISIGSGKITVGEIVFNTSMTGYQEMITDPSYQRQIITFTNPHIGNTGTNIDDNESDDFGCSGIILKNIPTQESNWRSDNKFLQFIKDRSLAAVCGVDTRYLTTKLRSEGSLRGCIVPDIKHIEDARKFLKEFGGLNGLDLAKEVTTNKSYIWSKGTHELIDLKSKRKKEVFKIFAYDFGIKKNILRILYDIGCDITVVPATYPSEKIIRKKPDGVFLSNGPGDPSACKYAIKNIEQLLENKIPTFGICLGFQLLALASGAKTYKMKFGHHGANHPVLDLTKKTVAITSQNHGFAVDKDTLTNNHKITHISLFDNSLQGIELIDTPAYGFQGHPEASPGPQDIYCLFEKFIHHMRGHNA